MDKIKVYRIKAQVRKALFTRLFHFPVHVIPHLGSDEQIFPLNIRLTKDPVKDLTDLILILVNGGTVDQTVTTFNCPKYRLRYLIRRIFIGSKSSKSYPGHFFPCI